MVFARVAQLVEHDLAKVGAAGSSPVSRLKIRDMETSISLIFMPRSHSKIRVTWA